MRLGRRSVITLALAALLAMSPACGGSSGGGSSGGGNCTDPFSTSLSGTWFVQEDVSTSSGGCGDSRDNFSVLCTQTDHDLVFLGRTTFAATLCGSRATNDYNFSVPILGGLRTYSNLVIQFSSETAFTGTASWTWNSGTNTCSGTSSFQGTR